MAITIKKINIRKRLNKFTSSMRFTMITTYFAVILITLILMSVYIIGLLSENLYGAERTAMFAKANIISETVSNIWDNDIEVSNIRFGEVVEKSLAGTNIRGVVVNTSYTVIYDTNKESELVGKAFMRDVLKSALDGNQTNIITTTDSGTKMLMTAVPIDDGENIIGGVYLAEMVGNIENTIRSARTSLIVFSTLIIILIGMLSLGMSYIITSPIEEFIEVAKEISKGNFSKKIAVKGRSEMAQMAETLNYMSGELELLEDKRRKFVSDASHELKTPMAGIKLICDSLVAAENLDREMLREFLSDMSDEVDRLTRVIDRLLVLTRLDAGASVLKAESVDIRMFINHIIKKLSGIAKSKDILLFADFHDIDFSPIPLDYDKMYEAIYNIADNAIKYSPEGSLVKIDVSVDKDELVIKIEDNGPGIPEEFRERIFERFYRLDDSRARDTGGTGLGLAISKEAVLMHGGSIEVTGAPEHGSIFIIRLPYPKLRNDLGSEGSLI